jgi:hypothetical protein
MPNWANNTAIITGTDLQLDAFCKKFEEQITETPESQKSLVNAFDPQPDVLNGTTSDNLNPDPHPNWATMLADGSMTQEWYDEIVAKRIDAYEQGVIAKAATGFSNWMDWQRARWGCKWGDCDTMFDQIGRDTIHIQYQTPWAPLGPQFWEAVTAEFPEIEVIVTWEEPGMAVEGAMAFRNGETHYNETQYQQSNLYDAAEEALEEV